MQPRSLLAFVLLYNTLLLSSLFELHRLPTVRAPENVAPARSAKIGSGSSVERCIEMGNGEKLLPRALVAA